MEPSQKIVNREHPYISLKEALEMADHVKAIGKASTETLAKAMGETPSGWFKLKVASVKRWGVVEGHGEMQVTQAYKDIKSEKYLNHALEVKRGLFLNIPLFKQIYDEYKNNGLPQEPYLTNAIADKFGLSGRNPKLVSNIIREFITEYFPTYGHGDANEEPQSQENKPTQVPPDTTYSDNSINRRFTTYEPTLPTDALFPIKIITRERTFDWDVKGEVDWDVVDSVIKSIKERWQKPKSVSLDSDKSGEEDERR